MEFRILSHACLLVKTDTHSIVVDPWLLGSCYWRSWWNFPPAQFDEAELAAVDAVVISHVHWDHWHGPTLKRLFKGKRVIVPDEPSMRSRKDLAQIGFKDVISLPHAQTINVGDIEITLHQFGLFLNDSAVVIRADGVTLLDANDAKIAGWSLEALLRRHGPIDFALRSHSSANPRVNFAVVGGNQDYIADDREHYFRSFRLFMNAVAPRYAVPFASNHCHLHDDVVGLNSYISNPLQLRDYCSQFDKQPSTWDLQVMLPGSSWNSETGFELSDEGAFLDLESSISHYRQRVSRTLQRNQEAENRTKVRDKTLDKFIGMLATKPVWKPKFCDFIMTLKWPDGRRDSIRISAHSKRWSRMPDMDGPQRGLPMMEMPASIFEDSVWKNMFHHAGISKRCHFVAVNVADLGKLRRIFSHLEAVELGVFPFSSKYMKRMLRAYVGRWREIGVYAKAIWFMLVSRKPIYLVEEMILSGTKQTTSERQT